LAWDGINWQGDTKGGLDLIIPERIEDDAADGSACCHWCWKPSGMRLNAKWRVSLASFGNLSQAKK